MDAPLILYVLKLKCGKYYVGTTKNLEQRLQAHIDGDGSTWTLLYPYDEIITMKEIESILDEDLEVKKLMQTHGIENVRGGSYSQVELLPFQVRALKNELTHNKGNCFNCQERGHYASSCPNKKESNSERLEVKRCIRCGRYGHLMHSCYAKTLKFMNIPIEDINFCHLCGRKDHCQDKYSEYGNLPTCSYKTTRDREKIYGGTDYCMRCGRDSHEIVECYARKTYDGDLL